MTNIPAPIATLTKQGVSMGDHAQDVVTAVEIAPGETVEALAHRVLTRSEWPSRPRRVEDEWYLTIRIPTPATPATESRTA